MEAWLLLRLELSKLKLDQASKKKLFVVKWVSELKQLDRQATRTDIKFWKPLGTGIM